MHFLDVGKTERTSAREIVRMAKENGYISIDEAMNNGKVNPGDKIYAVNKDKAVALFIMGKNKLYKFAKLETYEHVFQAKIDEAKREDYYMKGQWNKAFFKNLSIEGVLKKAILVIANPVSNTGQAS